MSNQYPDNAWGMDDNPNPMPAGGSNYDAYPGHGQVSASDDRTFATIAALSGPVGMLFSLGWLGFAGPLIVWAIYKDRSPFLRQQSARAFNFQLGMTLLSILAWILVFTLILVPVSAAIWIIVFIFSIYHPVKAAMGYSRGEPYRYPLSFGVLN